ncbi:unnamed protein product [Ambrosiozyma monospora]|uniref:Unnamed protein product n=1 Tax=Ambrosiozyma monospora TaxID=43982 RepID=A0ACB5T839_AMBMO|nr:unnamed protein product [Ambrosiozyma monospora]
MSHINHPYSILARERSSRTTSSTSTNGSRTDSLFSRESSRSSSSSLMMMPTSPNNSNSKPTSNSNSNSTTISNPLNSPHPFNGLIGVEFPRHSQSVSNGTAVISTFNHDALSTISNSDSTESTITMKPDDNTVKVKTASPTSGDDQDKGEDPAIVQANHGIYSSAIKLVTHDDKKLSLIADDTRNLQRQFSLNYKSDLESNSNSNSRSCSSESVDATIKDQTPQIMVKKNRRKPPVLTPQEQEFQEAQQPVIVVNGSIENLGEHDPNQTGNQSFSNRPKSAIIPSSMAAIAYTNGIPRANHKHHNSEPSIRVPNFQSHSQFQALNPFYQQQHANSNSYSNASLKPGNPLQQQKRVSMSAAALDRMNQRSISPISPISSKPQLVPSSVKIVFFISFFIFRQRQW